MPKAKGDEQKKKSKLPMVVVALVVVIGGYKTLGGASAKEAPPADPHKIEEGVVIPLPDLTLNLADKDPRYLRVGLALILEKGTAAEAVKEELPIASDVAVDTLSAKTFGEMNSPGAKQAIKAELSEKVRAAFHDEKVARVIFTSFVMQ